MTQKQQDQVPRDSAASSPKHPFLLKILLFIERLTGKKRVKADSKNCEPPDNNYTLW